MTDFSALLRIMFDKLQRKWKVSSGRLFLILATFAIGGSLTGWAGKKIMNWLAVDSDFLWVVLYIIVVTLVWPVMVLLISIPFGQFRFFIRYIGKLGRRIGIGRKIRETNSSGLGPGTEETRIK